MWTQLLAVSAVGIAVYVGLVFTSIPPLSSPVTSFDASLRTAAPSSLFTTSAAKDYNYGRWKAPVANITFVEDAAGLLTSQSLYRHFTQKKWNFFTVATDRFLVATAFVQLNYLADVFLYVVDKKEETGRVWEYHGRLPIGFGLDIAASSIDGCTTWASNPLNPDKKDSSVCYNKETKQWVAQADVTVESRGESRPIKFQFTIETTQGLVLLFPLDDTLNRPAYVHKVAGAPTDGELVWNGQTHSLKGHGTIDWTKANAKRDTVWKWASFAGAGAVTITEGENVSKTTSSIGINLSSDVYDVQGHSQENGLWIDGKVFSLAGVKFAVPAIKDKETWTVQSLSQTETVSLTFKPIASRSDNTNVVLLVSDFTQSVGTADIVVKFSPKAGVQYEVELHDVLGVMEDHHAIW